MTTAQLSSTTALFVAPPAGHGEVSSLLRSLGYDPVSISGLKSVDGLRSPISLCLIDLQQNGEALRIARAMRSQHPETVVIGIADPDRPATAADAIRAGVFDVLPRPPQAKDLGALIDGHCRCGDPASQPFAGVRLGLEPLHAERAAVRGVEARDPLLGDFRGIFRLLGRVTARRGGRGVPRVVLVGELLGRFAVRAQVHGQTENGRPASEDEREQNDQGASEDTCRHGPIVPTPRDGGLGA